MKEIVLDTETTGINVKEGHRIVEIGCVELDNLIQQKKFHYYINPSVKFQIKLLLFMGIVMNFINKKIC